MRVRVVALYLCFAICGASALVSEIVWQRMLTLLFGRSTLSRAAVLAAFLAGLALGARLFAAPADRQARPTRLYALIELAIALAGISSAFVIGPLMKVF